MPFRNDMSLYTFRSPLLPLGKEITVTAASLEEAIDAVHEVSWPIGAEALEELLRSDDETTFNWPGVVGGVYDPQLETAESMRAHARQLDDLLRSLVLYATYQGCDFAVTEERPDRFTDLKRALESAIASLGTHAKELDKCAPFSVEATDRCATTLRILTLTKHMHG